MLSNQYTYLLIDISCIIVTLLASFHPKSPFYKDWKYYLPSNFLVTVLFLIWDYKFTALGIWGFNDQYITGIKVLNLPIEEILFFICIPYACTYTYYVLSKYASINFELAAKRVGYTLVGLMVVTTVLYTPKLYTSITSLLLAILLVLLLRNNVKYLDRFFVVYLIILVPFFISNGLLTGSYLDEPIVWYNDDYNLGIRMFTIPVEDAFYAMLMLLSNITGYEWLKNKSIKPLKSIDA